jgi:hypothetical protein
MDTAEMFVTGGGLALIAFTLWFFFGAGEEAPVAAGGESLYACPMHPWVTSNDPTANCSICGMKLTARD